jgi:lipopolysaccharide export system protein LptA
MHRLKVILGTIIVVVVACAVYIWMQPSHTPRTEQRPLVARPVERPAPTTASTQSVIHAGEQIWVQVPDEKTGRLAWRFRAARYDPQPDNSVNVSQPQAEFFFSDGTSVTIEGTHGRVVVPGDMGPSSNLKSPGAPPSRGELYDVVISLYDPQRKHRPMLVCKVNNVAFDNDTFRIATESFKKLDGTTAPADQVPVEVRGDEYDFDGRGLVIRWNDRDRRLESLEIAHGESLTVKNLAERLGETERSAGGRPAAKASAPSEGQTKPQADSPPGAASGRSQQVRTQVPARGNSARASAATASTTQELQPVYRATFYGGVTVTQGEQQLARADTMAIDFRPEDQAPTSEDKPATQRRSPATSTARKVQTRSTTDSATTRPDNRHLPAIVRWPGKLVIKPVETGAPVLEPGEMGVELVSDNSATQLNYSGWDVVCASCSYFGGGRGAELRSSPAVPIITVKDTAGAIVKTPSLKYDADKNHAILDGASTAQFPIPAQGGSPASTLLASWTKTCVLTVSGKSQQDLTVEQADITGDVDIQHPRVKLRSDALKVALAPSTNPDDDAPQIKQLVASGQVRADLTDEQQVVRHITSERLTIDTRPGAGGELALHKVIADGSVRTFDDEQELTAAHLEATLAPTTRPTDTPRVESFLAQQDVVFKSKQARGRAELLTATVEGDDYNIRLQGQPSTIGNDDSMLAGRLINVRPGAQVVEVVGAGSLKGVQRSSPHAKPTPFEVTWDKSLNFSGARDRADVDGNVVVASVSSDGSKNTATGEKLALALMDDPKAATQPAEPATKPRDPMMGGFDSLASKTVRSMTLEGETEVRSILADAGGGLLRRMHLFAPRIVVDAESQTMVVPSAGRLLYEDLRPTTQPTTAPASPLGNFSGATAFQWSKQLHVDQKANRARMIGEVVIVHQEAAGTSEPFRLDADQVTADFELDPNAEEKPDNLTPSTSSMNIKMVTAEGQVHFTSRQIQFDADQISFDPVQELITARGSERVPVRVYDSNGASGGSFVEIGWETRTQRVKHVKNVQAVIRR